MPSSQAEFTTAVSGHDPHDPHDPIVRQVDRIDRQAPPHNIEAEQSVLGAIVLQNQVAYNIIPILQADDFYRPAHRLLYEVMLDLLRRDRPVDPITLKDELVLRDSWDRVGGKEGLAQIMTAVPHTAHAEHHARIVHDRAQLRRLIEQAREIQQDATDQGHEEGEILSAADIIDRAEHRIFELTDRRGRTGGPRVMKDLMDEVVERIENPKVSLGIASGFHDLDALTGGFRPGELIIVAARPSMGKTTFALNIARHAAVEGERQVAIFCLEMTQMQLAMNILSSLARVDAGKLRRGELSAEDYDRLLAAAGRLHEARIWIDDCASLTPMELMAKCRRLAATGGLDLVVVDYLQLVHLPPNRKIQNREQEISAISRSMKQLARELKVPVICMSQLSRGPETRDRSHRPRMSDLRESGAIEQDADAIVLLYREEYYEPDKDETKGLAEIILAKQRNGPTGTVTLGFRGNILSFDNRAPGGG